MLHYDLTENLLTPIPDDYMARVINVRSYSNSEVADLMLHKGAGMTKSDILSVLELYNEVICDIVAEGDAVTSPLFNAYPSISGAFQGVTDMFQSSRHKVKINLNKGVSLRDAVKRIKTERTKVMEPLPYIVEVKDVLSRTSNDILTPGGVIEIRGSRLKFTESNPDNGVFLIDEKGTSHRCATVVENKPGRLIIMLLNTLSKGTYTLEVRTTYGPGRENKSIKTGRFIKELFI